MKLQIERLKKGADKLQKKYGSRKHKAIYGAGKTSKPDVLFLFMNPTAKNFSADPKWGGLRAPWIGTKNIWKMLHQLNLLDFDFYNRINSKDEKIWNENFASNLYSHIGKNSVYITNLAKCTQVDARALKNNIFREYLENTLEEIYLINPKIIVAFGNQVSSILLNKNIKVSEYDNSKSETLKIRNRAFQVHPVYYPVGQGMRNLPKAVKIIKKIIK